MISGINDHILLCFQFEFFVHDFLQGCYDFQLIYYGLNVCVSPPIQKNSDVDFFKPFQGAILGGRKFGVVKRP